MLPRKIAVLLHRDDIGFESSRFILKLLMMRWQEMGVSIEVVRGIDRPIDADLLVPHINLTIVPPDYAAFMAEYPNVVNRHLLDTSKSRISTNIVGPDATYEGPVIVKTDRNYGGLPEKRLLGNATTTPVRRTAEGVLTRIPGHTARTWRRRTWLDPNNYPVYDALSDVPASVFKNKHLIVEKFLPEVDEGGYCLRNWTFFGGQGRNMLSRSNHQIVKAANVVHREEAPLPDELREFNEGLKADYAKFDYIIRAGRVVLLDVNRTPTYGGRVPSEAVLRTVRVMAEGVRTLQYT